MRLSNRIISLVLSIIMISGLWNLNVVSVTAKEIDVIETGATQADSIVSVAINEANNYGGYLGSSTKYNNYNGLPWCAYFMVWCAREAGIGSDIIPSIYGCTSLTKWYKDRGLFQYSPAYGGSYAPKAGDLVIFDWDPSAGNGQDHVGIVTGINGNYVSTVEGNSSGNGHNDGNLLYRTQRLALNHKYIAGYCTPAYTDSPVTPVNPVEWDNPDSYPFPTRDIYYRSSNTMTGSDVKWVQAVLRKLSYSIDIDGSFGPASEAVVKQFQSDHGLEVDGSVGPATRQKLYDLWQATKGNNPTGVVDGLEGGVGTVNLSGWAFDTDDINSQLNIHVYIGGNSGDNNAEGNSIWANGYRPDVDAVYGCGGYHGFTGSFPTSKTGNQPVYVYAINVGGGENIEIGSGTVYIYADTEAPTFEGTYISQVTQDSFRVCAVPKDNVGIKNVRIATWTQSNQSDLIWHDMSNNGTGTYFADLNRSDYSGIANSVYINHIYAYDYAGNARSIACNMDYRITSDTGKNIPEGEYRIATAVNESKFLDVANGSSDNGANIRIYNNYISPKQTFRLEYMDNGFYRIVNTYSEKALDVANDTYLSGTNVMQYTPHDGANQQWMIKPSGDGYYYIIARSNNLALDVYNGLDANSTNVQVFSQNQTNAQKWKLRRVLKDDMIAVSDVSIGSDTEEVTPEINVIVDGSKLIENTDYIISVTNDIEGGKGTITVTGINNYCDTVTKEFSIQVLEPTQPPTEVSTETPTEAPTVAPTVQPTDVPTEPPTEAPTEVPTEPVTEEPTVPSTEPADDIDTGTTGDCNWSFNKTTGQLRIYGNGNMGDYTTRSSVPWYQYRTEIKTVAIEEGVEYIGSMAFMSCSNIERVILADSVTHIGRRAFMSCSSLSEISPMTQIKVIDERAFLYCSEIKSIALSDNIDYIGESAFSFTGWSENHSDGPAYFGKILYKYFGQCPDEVVIEEGTRSISEYAFINRITLKRIKLPNTLTVISKRAFIGCSSLETIDIPDSVTSIEEFAFRDCSSLKIVTIPSSVTSIGNNVFENTAEDLTIYGYKDSVAETYANDNGITFIDINNPPTEPTTEYILGDANGDGIVTILDATVIQRYLAAYTVRNPDTVVKCGDIAGDGLDILDATLIQRYLAEFTVPYDIGQPSHQ